MQKAGTRVGRAVVVSKIWSRKNDIAFQRVKEVEFPFTEIEREMLQVVFLIQNDISKVWCTARTISHMLREAKVISEMRHMTITRSQSRW